jgi:exodeoxyribonuclease V alpha subunit
VPHRTALQPLTQKVIIVDEAGMVPLDLWNNLLAATPANTRIYLLGDIYQLPPVHGRSVLGFAMLKWPTYELDRIHRTDNDAITQGAWDIMNGKMPESANGSVALKRLDDGSLKAYQQILATIQHLSKAGIFHPLRDGLIVPQNRDQLGQETLNERLCAFFNPPREKEGIVINPRTIITAGYTHVSFAVGDKVMVTQNDRTQGLTNGMVGVIESIVPNAQFKGESVGDMAMAHLQSGIELDLDAIDDLLDNGEAEEEIENLRERQASHIATIKFQNTETPIEFTTAGAINTLKHAYAFTCHKSQGGEYPVVAIVVHSANLRMLTREWLYTAWTRTQDKVLLLYNRRGIQQALNRQVIVGKTLKEKAKKFIEITEKQNMGDEGAKVPNLPEACTL